MNTHPVENQNTMDDEIFKKRESILALLSDEEMEIVKYWYHKMKNRYIVKHRSIFYDLLTHLDNCLEVIFNKVVNIKQVLKMCINIQSSISNDDIRQGWKVSFEIVSISGKGHHRYFYLNDKLKRKKIIKFYSNDQKKP